jgi:ABC-2 type transport system permease protein
VKTLFHALGIDYGQWKALTLTALKIDLRAGRLGGAAFRGSSEHRNRQLVGLLIMYGLLGAFSAILVVSIKDLMLSGTIVLTYLMFMVGAMILLDHNSVITSPDDYAVLGFRPISSRTFFAARLANVLFYTAAVTTSFGAIPIVAYAIVHGWRVGAAAVFAFFLSTTFITLLMVLVYAWLLRTIGADRLTRALSYVQLVTGFIFYGGYLMMTQAFDRRAMASLKLPDSAFIYLYPSTWFASYLPLASAETARSALLPVAVSLVAVGLLAATLAGRLSLQYAQHLGALTAATAARAPSASRRRRPVWFKAGEERAVALLVRAQFRNDQKFRMGVLGILPLTVLYLFISLRHGPLPDPFGLDWRRAGDVMLISLAILAFPTTLRQTFSRSDSYKAAWIYFTAPVERSRVVRATKNVLVAFFLLPYLSFVTVVLVYFTGHPIHVLVHMAFLGLLSHLFLQTITFIDPALPFSQPLQKGTRSGVMILTMMMAFGGGLVLVPVLSMFVYVSVVRMIVAAALLAATSAAGDWLTRVRVEQLAERMEFVG